MSLISSKYEETLKELLLRGIPSEWIKGIVVHLSDIMGAGRNHHLESLYDYLEAITFQKTPPYEHYTVQYKIIDIVDEHQILLCVWIEEE